MAIYLIFINFDFVRFVTKPGYSFALKKEMEIFVKFSGKNPRPKIVCKGE